MGKKPIGNDPDPFASDLNAYFQHVVSLHTKARDGRWLASVTDGTRGKGYWAGLLNGTRAMNTNDIDVIARTFSVSPFDFVRYAQMHAAGEETPDLNVGGSPETGDTLTAEQEQAIRKGDLGLAALRGDNEANRTPAD